jgi:hypothetical protein
MPADWFVDEWDEQGVAEEDDAEPDDAEVGHDG